VCVVAGLNPQQLQQILTVAAVIAPVIQNSQTAANQMSLPAVNQQPVLNQQNTGCYLLLFFYIFLPAG